MISLGPPGISEAGVEFAVCSTLKSGTGTCYLWTTSEELQAGKKPDLGLAIVFGRSNLLRSLRLRLVFQQYLKIQGNTVGLSWSLIMRRDLGS